MSNIADRVSEFLFRNRNKLAIFSTIAFIICLPGGRFLQFDSNYRIFINDENRFYKQLQHIESVYQSGEDSMVFLVEAQGGSVFTAENLQLIRDLTQEARLLKYSIDVESLANFQYIKVDQHTFETADLIPLDQNLLPGDVEEIKKVALTSPAVRGRFVSATGRLASIVVYFKLTGNRTQAVMEISKQCKEIRARLLKQYPDAKVYLSGLLMFDQAMIDASILDILFILPLVGISIFALLWYVFRSVLCAIYVIAIVVLTAISAYAVVGWFGYNVNILSIAGTITMSTLAVADSVHLISTYLTRLANGSTRDDALRYSIRTNWVPMTLTTATDVVGFLCLTFSPSPPVQELGLFTSIGVTLAYLLTVTLIPCLVMLGRQQKGLLAETGKIAAWVGRLTVSHHKPLFVVFTLISLAFVPFALMNRLNDDSLTWFSRRMEFRQSVDLAARELEGLKSITYSLDTRVENGVLSVPFMKRVDHFTQWLQSQPEVTGVRSYLDTIKDVHQRMNGNDPAFYRLPDSQEQAAQFLLARELSVPSSRNLNDLISIDKREVRLIVSVKNIPNREYLAFEQRASAWLAENAPGIVSIGTSVPLIFAELSQQNLHSMINGSLAAIGVIAVLLGLAFRSARLGLLSLVPNTLPIGVVYGGWGIGVGMLDMAAVTVFTEALGVIVDDTIHCLYKYRMARAKGLSPGASVEYMVQMSGSAVGITTVVLVLGFGFLAFSNFQLSATQGLLLAFTIFLALLYEMFYLSPLMMLTDRKGHLP